MYVPWPHLTTTQRMFVSKDNPSKFKNYMSSRPQKARDAALGEGAHFAGKETKSHGGTDRRRRELTYFS